MSRSGFTLTEAVIALAVVTAVAGVAAQALVTSLRAEQRALRLAEAGLVADRMLTAARLEQPPPDDADWRRDEREESTGGATNRVRWLLLDLTRTDGGAGARCALRQPERAADRGRRDL